MAIVARNIDRLTVDMPPELRALIDRMGEDKGWSAAKCVRHILAAYFAQLQQEEATP